MHSESYINDFPLHYFHLFYLTADSLEPVLYLSLTLSCMSQLSTHFNAMSFSLNVAKRNLKRFEQDWKVNSYKQSVASGVHEIFAKWTIKGMFLYYSNECLFFQTCSALHKY